MNVQKVARSHFKDYRSPYIQKCLKGEGMVASRREIYKFIKRFVETGSIFKRRR